MLLILAHVVAHQLVGEDDAIRHLASLIHAACDDGFELETRCFWHSSVYLAHRRVHDGAVLREFTNLRHEVGNHDAEDTKDFPGILLGTDRGGCRDALLGYARP